MDEASLGMSSPPFGPGDRASGILLHVTSLPSPYGIGDLGPSAFAWVDRLARSGQSWWQALPLGPTGYGDSPYQPLSSFAGNILLISPDGLIADGLLRPGELEVPAFPTGEVDYPTVTRFKHRLLERAWSNFRAGAAEGLRPAFERFRLDQAHWLDDYALFRALKIRHGGAHYLDWPEPLVRRDPAALDAARRELADLIDLARFGQFLVVHQGDRLRDYARTRGVHFIGDLPFFVSPDSADVWADPQFFQLDARCRPRLVAGVPPDYFSPEGQLWGNPVYDWEALRRAGYRWWIDRLRALLAHVDVVRLDHFRGFAAAWHVPAGASTAREGQWLPGPGEDLFRAARAELGRLPLIAEDLGHHHARRPPAPRGPAPPGDEGAPVRIRREPRQPVPPPQLRPRHRRVHGHPRQRHDAGLVRDPAGGATAGRLELPRPIPRGGGRGRLGAAPPRLVVRRRAGHGPAPGRVEPRVGGPDEPSRQPGGQLALAGLRRHALRPDVRSAR